MTRSQTIEAARLRLEPLATEDVDAFHALMIEPGVRRYLCDDKIMSRKWADGVIADSLASFAAYGWGLWAVREKSASALIGVAGFREFFAPPELQLLYALHPDRWGKGLATEASVAVMRYGFERLGMSSILTAADAPNVASLAVMRRLGLRLLRRTTDEAGDRVYYGIERQEWEPPALKK